LVLAAYFGLFTFGFLVATTRPVTADNCQTFTDCFATADAGSDALLGLTFLGMLSMAINFIPYVGTAKGVIEAVTGEDLLTGQELSTTDRLLGLIPGGLGKGSRFGKVAGSADEMADLSRLGRAGRLGDAIPPGGGRYIDDAGDYAYHVGEDYIARTGRGPFPNTMADELAGELARADRAGVRPITPASSTFDDVVNGGRIKWAVTTDGELLVIPKNVDGVGEIPHSVITRGGDVLAAGEAEIASAGGVRFGSDITAHSGHFRPSLESLDVAREAFARYGITFP
jgi:hypothetical protein